MECTWQRKQIRRKRFFYPPSRFPQKLQYAQKRLSRLRELLDLPMGTKTAQTLWRDRLNFYITFYEKLARQLACSESVLDG